MKKTLLNWDTYRYEILPYYMSLGLSIEFINNSTPKSLLVYDGVFKCQQRLFNEHAWLQGRYIYEAIGTVVANMFSKGNSNYEYLKEPYPLFGAKKQSNVDPEVNEKVAYMEMLAYSKALKKERKIGK